MKKLIKKMMSQNVGETSFVNQKKNANPSTKNRNSKWWPVVPTDNPILADLLKKGTFEQRGKTYPIAYCSPSPVCAKYRNAIVEAKCQSILEIGTLFGLSTLFLAEAASRVGGEVTTVDLRPKTRRWKGKAIESVHEVAERLVQKSGYENIVEFVTGDSTTVLPEFVEEGRVFDFALIDGSHEFPVVLIDFINCDNLLRKGGFIAMDDVGRDFAVRRGFGGGPNRLLQVIFSSNRYKMTFLSSNVVLCRKLEDL